MNKFEMPRLTVSRFSAEDIITTSAGGITPGTNGFTRGNDATAQTKSVSILDDVIASQWEKAITMGS